jgi:hypothetical protein
MNKYFPKKKYEVLENQTFILIYKKMWWFDCIKMEAGFNKDNYYYNEDEEMIIIKEL